MIRSQDNPYLTYSRILVVLCCYTWICHLDLLILCKIAGCDGYHAWGRRCLLNLEHLVVSLAGSTSHTSIQYIDFVEILMFYWICLLFILFILVDVKVASFAYSSYMCYSILECYNLFSGVKLSVRSFCFIIWSQFSIYFLTSIPAILNGTTSKASNLSIEFKDGCYCFIKRYIKTRVLLHLLVQS